MKDFGDHVVLYNTRHISLEGNMWEEHCYHFKSDWSQKKLKQYYYKNRSVTLISLLKINGFRATSDRHARLPRNFYLTAEEAHAFDPTYVVRESVYK